MNFSLKSALAGGGAVLVVLSSLFTFLATDATDPDFVEDAVDVAFSPAPRCQNEAAADKDWVDSSESDEHARVISCAKDGWIVYLNPDDSFNYALKDGASEFEFDKGKVTGWPD